MPKKFPEEFQPDVVTVARSRWSMLKRWWGYWQVRDLPEIPRRLIGAVVHIRHSYSAQVRRRPVA